MKAAVLRETEKHMSSRIDQIWIYSISLYILYTHNCTFLCTYIYIYIIYIYDDDDDDDDDDEDDEDDEDDDDDRQDHEFSATISGFPGGHHR